MRMQEKTTTNPFASDVAKSKEFKTVMHLSVHFSLDAANAFESTATATKCFVGQTALVVARGLSEGFTAARAREMKDGRRAELWAAR